ncbi:hypothetical protein IJG95_01400 [Candidatus Saccharibacteria bacterium]|nr:hypothetical protein [Candidatus Saccharibacteria bacterium]
MEKSGAEVKTGDAVAIEQKNVSVLGYTASEQKKPAKELTSKQKKVWIGVLAGVCVLIVGLIIAIVAVANMRPGNNTECPNAMTEEEEKEAEEAAIIEEYAAVQETINKVIESTRNIDLAEIVKTYQYYINDTEDTTVKNMLRMDLLMVEMGYDTEKTRGDELIDVAIEIDGEAQSSNSAALVMALADNYGKTELYDEYKAIFNERLIKEGYNPDEETKG